QGDNTVSIGGWGNVPPKPYKPTICLRILLALENEDPTLNKYAAPHTTVAVLNAVAHRYNPTIESDESRRTSILG
ncbi:hypothetical protein, partial [Vacuolonema iberomarrocanum]|uniref:hypothetical protein n=1 Tax=Vacuolonema iberomarrocanum TaxID=3454632 RepID=UPI003F6DFF87